MAHVHKNMQNSAETEPRIETPAITPREMGILNLKLPEKVLICFSGIAFNTAFH